MRYAVILLLMLLGILRVPARAQNSGSSMPDMSDMPKNDGPQNNPNSGGSKMDMSGMNMSGMNMPGMHAPQSLIEQIEMHATAGTDAVPLTTPAEMLMKTYRGWTFMFHGEAFVSDIQQSGPRGADRFFSTNWFMPMAQRQLGRGQLTLRMMLSLEPATVTERRYPELFQQGETAFGVPIVDGQHPHDLFMELAALYDYKLSEKTLLSVYAAPMGDPALGPVAYPHRESAAEDPIATLGHHLEDSTHIAADVITVGFTHRNFRFEASGFHGREPDENRWNINSGKLDSWSFRGTLNFHQNSSGQFSLGQLHSPESLAPSEDLRRMTASVTYNRPLHRGNWDSLLLWGRNQSLLDGNVGNAYLLESTLKFLERNSVWSRIENVDRTNELLLGENPEPAGFSERYFTRVQAYTLGYDREVLHIPHVSPALGGQFSWYGVPEDVKATYGEHPVGGVMFVRVRFR